MKGIQNFIIELDTPYFEKFKSSNGVEFFGTTDFNADRLSNRVAIIKGIPELFESEIKVGYEVLIDFSNFYRQIYRGVKQWYQAIIDEEANLYHLTSNMIICYREDSSSEWKGFENNSLVKPIYEQSKINTSLIVPENNTKKEFKGKVQVVYANQKLREQEVTNGTIVYMNPLGGVKYWFEGKEYWWIRNCDVYGIVS
ncbi:hypothetical protein [Tenacibaculum sp. 190524A02b]|uniref:hypothetical protein n=1 Tax=Tenacibaculum vairaonense TaxID=3137860 RepID=UPI0031FA60BC